MNTYTPGQTVPLQVQFISTATGLPIAPSTVLLRVLPPGTEIDYTMGFDNPSTGVYSLNIVVYTPGIWNYRWIATAPFFAAGEAQFEVLNTSFLINTAAGEY